VSFINSEKKYEYLSNSLLGIFFILLACAALLTDIFHSPIKSSIEASGMATLFKMNEFIPVSKISLKNKSGTYIFEKIEKNQISPWHMISPRNITANSIFIEKLFTSLSTIKIKKIFPNDKINQLNFSLDKPNASLTMESVQTQKIINLDIGLVNTIDNTTYIKVSDKNSIYQVEVPNLPIENASILDLIESKIFSIDLENISSFKVSYLKISNGEINIQKSEKSWLNSDKSIIPLDKIEEYFQDLSTIKSTFVIDTISDQQKRTITNLMRSPDISLTAKDNKNNIITYRISSLFNNFPDLDLKNSSYFLVTISNNQTVYIVKKEFL
jgi:hypothetical protein